MLGGTDQENSTNKIGKSENWGELPPWPKIAHSSWFGLQIHQCLRGPNSSLGRGTVVNMGLVLLEGYIYIYIYTWHLSLSPSLSTASIWLNNQCSAFTPVLSYPLPIRNMWPRKFTTSWRFNLCRFAEVKWPLPWLPLFQKQEGYTFPWATTKSSHEKQCWFKHFWRPSRLVHLLTPQTRSQMFPNCLLHSLVLFSSCTKVLYRTSQTYHHKLLGSCTTSAAVWALVEAQTQEVDVLVPEAFLRSLAQCQKRWC